MSVFWPENHYIDHYLVFNWNESLKVYSPFPQWKMPKGEKPKHVTPAHTEEDKNNKPPWVPAGCLFQTHHALLCSSYPVLLVLLLVFRVGVHVGAHTGVAGCAGDAADAVRGVLPPDAQVRLLILLLLLWTTVTAGWGETVRSLVWKMSFSLNIKLQPNSVVNFWWWAWFFSCRNLGVKFLYNQKVKKIVESFFAWYVLWSHSLTGKLVQSSTSTSSLLFKYPWTVVFAVCICLQCLHLSCPL